MEALFYHIYLVVQRNKIFACIVALLFLIGCGCLASRLRFEEDITQIIPKNEKTDVLSRAIKQINFADKITVLIEKSDTTEVSRLAEVAASFVDSIRSDSLFVRKVTGQVGAEELASAYDFVYRHLPLFLDKQDYTRLEPKLSSDSIAAQLAQNYRTLMSPMGMVMGDFIQKDPLGLAVMGLEKVQRNSVGEHFMLFDNYIVTKDTSRLLLFLDPVYQGADTEHNTALVEHLDRLCQQMNSALSPSVKISYYGAAPIAVANAKQIKNDISTTVVISMSVLMLLLIFFYRKIYIPLLVFVPTVFAALLAIACLYLYKPVISAISLSIGAVLLGITIDYTLHVLTHYKRSANVRDLYHELTRPLLMSGATNAVAFLCLLFVHSEALIDLGIFASICIFGSAVFTLLIIPHLYRPKKQIRYNSMIDRLASFPFERSKILIIACCLLMVVSCFTGSKVGYNNNIAALNFVPDNLRLVEKQLDSLMNTSSKSIYLIATGETFEEAAEKSDRLAPLLTTAKENAEIINFSGSNLLPLSCKLQQQKIVQWDVFWNVARRNRVITTLKEQGEELGFAQTAYQPFYELLQAKPQPLTFESFRSQEVLGLSDLLAEKDGFFTISTLVKLEEGKRPAFIKRLQEQEPEILLIDRQHLNETFLGQLRDDFNRLIGYSFIAVLLVLWFFFRRVELVLLSAIPIGLTGLVTTGLMGIFGLEFNIFSAIVSTLVFGHGVDFSIFMTAALQKQYSTGKDELQTYRTSILLAVLTTVLAIGALIFAKHPALLSIASVSLVGVFAAVIITFVFYPILFRFFISDRAKKGKSPFTISILCFSLLFFIYYGLGCLLVSFCCRIGLLLFPWSRERKDKAFRKVMAVFMKSVLYLHPQTKNYRANPYGETFEKPAIVIANHSSFLDTLSLGMLVPKGIFLVNDWVWNSPIFGRAVKALGFYPVSKGLENGMELLRQKVAAGFSLIVFPEGTRSYDNVVRRFHKGAFYLAEQFKLDVLPVYLLGNGDVLPKGDILIFGGKLKPVIGRRIRYEDLSFGEGYVPRTKQITTYFREEYATWRREFESAFYFRKKLLLAYLYKDEEIVRAVRQNINQYALLYHELDKWLEGRTKVCHVSDTYGEMDYLLSLQYGGRKITGVIADDTKRAVAESIYWIKQRAVHFLTSVDNAEVLVLHPALDLNKFDPILLQSTKEIYTFSEEPLLTNKGWSKKQLSASVFHYDR